MFDMPSVSLGTSLKAFALAVSLGLLVYLPALLQKEFEQQIKTQDIVPSGAQRPTRLDKLFGLLRWRDFLLSVTPAMFVVYFALAQQAADQDSEAPWEVLLLAGFVVILYCLAIADRWLKIGWIESRRQYLAWFLGLVALPYIAAFVVDAAPWEDDASPSGCGDFSLATPEPLPYPTPRAIESPFLAEGRYVAKGTDGSELHAVVLNEAGTFIFLKGEIVPDESGRWTSEGIHVGEIQGEQGTLVLALVPRDRIRSELIFGEGIRNLYTNGRLPGDWRECARVRLQRSNPSEPTPGASPPA